MKRTLGITLAALLAAGTLTLPTGCLVAVHGRAGVVVDSEPPPPEYEVVPAPRSGYVWVRGYWAWHGRWVWRPGHWERHRGQAYVWVDGHWTRRGNRYHWVEGRWEKRGGGHGHGQGGVEKRDHRNKKGGGVEVRDHR
jgi:hypothetical protein